MVALFGWTPRGCVVVVDPLPAFCALLPYCGLLPSQVRPSHFWRRNMNCPVENPSTTAVIWTERG